MFRFFLNTTQEKNDLAEKQSLMEIVAEDDADDENKIENIPVSTPFDAARQSAHDTLHEEITTCLGILEKTKKNVSSYLIQEKKRLNFLAIYNLVCLLSTSGITGTLMYALHGYATDLAQQKLTPILLKLTQAIQERDTFMGWYNGEVDRQYKEIDKYIHSESYCGVNSLESTWDRFIVYCFTGNDLPRTTEPHGGVYYYDDCAVPPNKIHPGENCAQQAASRCKSQTTYFACLDPLYAQRYQAEQPVLRFKSEHTSHINELNQQVDQLKAESSFDPNTWEPISIGVFAGSAGICLVLATYLFKSWRNSHDEYQKDISRFHPLHECLKPEDLVRIINLTAVLHIPLKDMPIEILMSTLEVKKIEEENDRPRKEAKIAFLGVARHFNIPPDVSREILLEAEMEKKPQSIRP